MFILIRMIFHSKIETHDLIYIKKNCIQELMIQDEYIKTSIKCNNSSEIYSKEYS